MSLNKEVSKSKSRGGKSKKRRLRKSVVVSSEDQKIRMNDNSSTNSNRKEESVPSTLNPPILLPLHSTVERAIQIHDLAQNIRRSLNSHQNGASYHSSRAAFLNHEQANQRSSFLFSIILPWIKQTFYSLILMVIMTCVSGVLYVIFYNLSMPSNALSRNAYFDYSYELPNESIKQCNSQCYMGPWAVIDLRSKHNQWNAEIANITDTSQLAPKHILDAKQSYYIHLALTLPESSHNKDYGIFMVKMNLFHEPFQHPDNAQNETDSVNGGITTEEILLAHSSRPAMLPFQSNYVSNVKKSVLMVPLILGALPEASTIVVESFDHYLESEQYPLTKVRIELVHVNSLSHSTTTTSSANRIEKPIQVHKAELRIGVELNSFQKLLKKWFYTCAILGCLILTLIQMFLASFVKLLFRLVRNNSQRYSMYNSSNLEQVPWDDEDNDDLSYLDLSMNNDDDDHIDQKEKHDDDSDDWQTIPHESDTNGNLENKQHVHIDDAVGPIHLSEDNDATKKRKRRKKKKVKEHSVKNDDKDDGLKHLVNRVMQGDIHPYEVFTDLDEPS